MVNSCCRVLIWRMEFKSSRYEEGWKSVGQPAPFEDCLFRWIATLLCSCWGLPSQSSGPQDKTNYIFTETDFLFLQDSLVLILVSYWKSQFFHYHHLAWAGLHVLLYQRRVSWIHFQNGSFTANLKKNELQIQYTCIGQANFVLSFYDCKTHWFVWWTSMYAAGIFLNS